MESNDALTRHRRRPKLTIVTRYETNEDAAADARVLAEHDIRPIIVGKQTGVSTGTVPSQLPPIEIQVPVSVAFAAGQILRALDPPEADEPVADVSEQDVVFPCEDCGEMIAFPGYRQGKVEVCPECGEYVDVPERSRLTRWRQHHQRTPPPRR